jgi:cell division protein ZipA
MDMLRLSLIIVGILIIAGVYWWSRRDTTPVAKQPMPRIPPANTPAHETIDSAEYTNTNASFDTVPLGETDLQSYGQIVPGREAGNTTAKVTPTPRPAAEVLYATTSGEQLIISLTIIGHHGKRFTGEAILQAMQDLKLLHGDMRIFHYFAAESTRVPVLSIANIMEPGVFELDKLRTFDTPGLVVFLRLPGPLEARAALETLLTIGRGLAERLQGDLCDESRNVLTPQSIGYLREKVEAFRFKQKMSQLGTKAD